MDTEIDARSWAVGTQNDADGAPALVKLDVRFNAGDVTIEGGLFLTPGEASALAEHLNDVADLVDGNAEAHGPEPARIRLELAFGDLRQQGARLVGLCPLCGTEGSLSVNQLDMLFYCQTCFRGGSVVDRIDP